MTEGLETPLRFRAQLDRPPRLDRSPHPYFRSKVRHKTEGRQELQPSSPNSPSTSSDEERRSSGQRDELAALTPRSLSDSDLDVDDDAFTLTKALPAPELRPRKGLRSEQGLQSQDHTPLISSNEYQIREDELIPSSNNNSKSREKSENVQDKSHGRRRSEVTRRIAEVLLLVFICYIVTSLKLSLVVFVILLVTYPIRLLWPTRTDNNLRMGSIRIPSKFDPAPLIYPVVIPAAVALLISSDGKVIASNAILGLSSLPFQLFPQLGAQQSLNPIHWASTLFPVAKAGYAHSERGSSSIEYYSLLFPLHQSLLQPLYYLTTTSLLPSELHLLSVSLINLLLFSTSPQTSILSCIVWVGGMGLLVLTKDVLKWNTALERIPERRLADVAKTFGAGRSFIDALKENLSLNPIIDGDRKSRRNSLETQTVSRPSNISQKLKRSQTFSGYSRSAKLNGHSNITKTATDTTTTLPETVELSVNRKSRHIRSTSVNTNWYLSLTPMQINVRKWLYALYTYTIIILLILGPIRALVASEALQGWEPFGWAIGYLFGDIALVRDSITDLRLTSWVPLPQYIAMHPSMLRSRLNVDGLRHAIGRGNTRLLLFIYWAAVIGSGLLIVLRFLPDRAEVDTRRKIFHGMMVVMLLPTAYVDPCFLALGLMIVLAVFLLLDLLRASQLRPLSKPLARFLAPYVDGRDLSGPVVISHIFLLIGCAIPFWLSLGSYQRNQAAPGNPWAGWELAGAEGQVRDLSMVAGVVCVGMGDAAASLIGRRYGRRKWPWGGGKSLEGSAAFAAAVMIGLLAGKAWLWLGGWQTLSATDDGWATVLGKIAIAASGASFTEAVLTGANDNVVVPVILWLLIRGLEI